MLKSEIPNQEIAIKYTAAEESEILKIAVAHINIQAFVYDVSLRKLYFFESDTCPFGTLKDNEYTVQEIISYDIIDKEMTPIFESLFNKIQNGEKSAEAVIKMFIGSVATWNHIMLVNYYDEGGRPIRAIGTIQDVSNRIEVELLYSKEKQFRLAMLADSRRVYEVNVTRDRFTKLESIQDTTDYGKWNIYTQSMAQLCKTQVYREDWDKFLKIATRENLIEGFENGITEFYCEYRAVDNNGKISWVSSATHLLKDPISNDVKGFIYVKDIDEKKKREIQLYEQAERDFLTGVYNRRTAERLVTQVLFASDETQLHGFLALDLDGFKYVNDTFGHIKGDYVLQQISNEIGGIIKDNDIFARMGGDEFIIFLNNMNNTPHILEIAQHLCQCVRNIPIEEGSDFHLTISIGISNYPKDGNTFSELYKKSDYSLYQVKQHGKDSAAFY